jgi:DNA-binding HxlR family transcriptional regulator
VTTPDHAQGGDCDAVHRALALLGRAWAGAVLWAMLHGAERFTEVRAAVPGISDAVLTARLRELCDHGLVQRQVTPGPPVAVRYLLTDAGRGTRPVLEALLDFARQHPDELRDRPGRGVADRARTTLGT